MRALWLARSRRRRCSGVVGGERGGIVWVGGGGGIGEFLALMRLRGGELERGVLLPLWVIWVFGRLMCWIIDGIRSGRKVRELWEL